MRPVVLVIPTLLLRLSLGLPLVGRGVAGLSLHVGRLRALLLHPSALSLTFLATLLFGVGLALLLAQGALLLHLCPLGLAFLTPLLFGLGLTQLLRLGALLLHLGPLRLALLATLLLHMSPLSLALLAALLFGLAVRLLLGQSLAAFLAAQVVVHPPSLGLTALGLVARIGAAMVEGLALAVLLGQVLGAVGLGLGLLLFVRALAVVPDRLHQATLRLGFLLGGDARGIVGPLTLFGRPVGALDFAATVAEQAPFVVTVALDRPALTRLGQHVLACLPLAGIGLSLIHI